MKKRQWASLWLTVLALVVVLSACGGQTTSPATDSAATDSGSSETSKTLTIATSTDIESFDPHNNNNTASEAVLVNVFDYLVKNDSEQKKVPGLAESWEQVDDTTWRSSCVKA